MANCHSERSEESIGDSSPIRLRMTRWGVDKQSQSWQLTGRVSKDVVRIQHSKDLSAGLVLHDPEGSHYRRQPVARFFAEFTLSKMRFFPFTSFRVRMTGDGLRRTIRTIRGWQESLPAQEKGRFPLLG
jgi:hypothetical protein